MVADAPFRLLPRLDDYNRAFWTGGERGELLLTQCADCAYYVHPPGPICPRCLSRALRSVPASGRARIVSFTVNHQPWNPTMATPYVIALVELAEQEGLRLMTNIVGCDPNEVEFDLAVRVIFEHHNDVWIPLFEPDPA